MGARESVFPHELRVSGPFAANSMGLMQWVQDWWVREYGFRAVDLPWLVPPVYSAAHRPAGLRDFQTPHGSLVASGEVSFIWLRDAGVLPSRSPGYIGWTPCFRDEKNLTEFHQHAFLKLEWYVPLDVDDGGYALLLNQVSRQMICFLELARTQGVELSGDSLRPVGIPDGLDIQLCGIELGSYGIREFQGQRYIYGTALALPRFNTALEHARCTQPLARTASVA